MIKYYIHFKMNLLLLSSDVLNYQLTFLSIKHLSNLSRTNVKLRQLINTDNFWEFKLKLDYPTLINMKNSSETWKYFYYNIRVIYVLYKWEIYEEIIIIVSKSTLKEITIKIFNKLEL